MDDPIDRKMAIDAIDSLYFDTIADHDRAKEKIKRLPSAQPEVLAHGEGELVSQPEIIRCKDCKHRPVTNCDYDDDEWDCGFNIEFPDYKCPCQCDDAYYNRLPDDNWFCGNAERRTDETD